MRISPPRVLPRPRCTNLAGFTLVEMMVSIAMFAIIALALQSAVLIAGKAIPDAKGVNVHQLAASRALDQITGELTYALSVTELTATSVAFTVADRDKDGQPETIRYSWSGVSGAPLTREYNGKVATLLDDVREFTFAYDRRSVLNPTTYTESAESLLYSFSGGLLNVDYSIESSRWCGQYFVPTLPNNIEYWRITRVRFQAREHGSSDGIMRVQARTASASGLPTNVVLDQATVYESTMTSSYAWKEVSFANATGLDPSIGACIVFRWVNDADACDVLNKTVSLGLVGGHKVVTTSNTGASWSANVLNQIPLQVYGKSATKDSDTYKYYLTGVRATLRSGGFTAARANAAARPLSEPEVSAP